MHTLERRTISQRSTLALARLASEIAWHPTSARIEQIDMRVGELPHELHLAMRRPTSHGGAVVHHALSVEDHALGATPTSWRSAEEATELDIAMLLLARCAGMPFGWEGQQGGRLVNNIVPTKGHEHEQTGASSATLLSPHTEDAFHPRRANLLLLGCLRNPDRVGTTLSSVRDTALSDRELATLSTPAVPILPDDSYGTEWTEGAVPMPTVWAGEDGATLRYDPAYTDTDTAGDDYRLAYDRLSRELERVCCTAALAPGDLLLVDNDVAVHGRVPFTPRYDGSDRWLKRVNIREPGRARRAEESLEPGYGQHTVEPFAMMVQ